MELLQAAGITTGKHETPDAMIQIATEKIDTATASGSAGAIAASVNILRRTCSDHLSGLTKRF